MEPSRHGKHSAPRPQRDPEPIRPRSRRPVFIPVASVAVACSLVGAALAVHSLGGGAHGVLSASSTATPPLFGVSVSGRGGLSESTGDFGALPIIRTSYSRLPAANVWTTGPAGSNKSAAVVTFKARPRQVLSGADDVSLANFFAGAPSGHPIYYSYFPEPESAVRTRQFTAARYRAAWAHIVKLAGQENNQDLRATLILNARDLAPGSGVNWKNFLPGGGIISTLSWDAFPAGTSPQTATSPQAAPAQFMGPAVAAAESAGLPFGFSAFALGSSSGRPAWLKSVSDYLTGNGALFGVLYSSPGHPATQLSDAASIQAWRGIIAASAAGPSAPDPTSPAPTPTSPSPTATPTSPSPSPSSPSPSPSAPSPSPSSPSPSPTGTGPSGPECVTSAAQGSCGPYTDAAIDNSAGGNTTVGQNVWSPINGWSQTLHATGPQNWHVVANLPKGNTAVVSYPNTGTTYGETKLSGFSSIVSSFSENMNATSGTSAWAAFDIWLNNWNNEVMIQHDFANNGPCDAAATATFGGSNGVPVQKWDLCVFGSELVWKLTGGSEQSGSVDVLAMLNWLADHGYYSRSSGLTDISYGWELCSTGGQNETFALSRYTVTAK